MAESNVPQLVDKKGGSYSATAPRLEIDYKTEYKKVKAKLTLLEAGSASTRPAKPFQSKSKGIVDETFDWDEEEVSDDEDTVQVKVLMALADDELAMGKNHARNGEWIGITMRKPSPKASTKPSPQSDKAKKTRKRCDASPEPSDYESSSNLMAYKDLENYVPTSDIKAMVTEIIQAFKGSSSSTLLRSTPIPTIAIIEVNAPVGGGKKSTTVICQSPFVASRHPNNINNSTPTTRSAKVPIIKSTRPSFIDPILEVTPPEVTPSKVTPITKAGGSSFITPKANKGKSIAKESDPSLPKLVRAIKQVHQDLDALVLFDYMHDGKMVQITGDKLQAIMDKKEQMEKTTKDIELSKPTIMKVAIEIVNEIEVQISCNKEFLKHQDTYL
ncbi:hypothetical protein Tco_0889371 [Tanacetum coccineum]